MSGRYTFDHRGDGRSGGTPLFLLERPVVAALAALPRDADRLTVFNTSVQAYSRFSINRAWGAYRAAAGCPGATFAQIRDFAFTAACRASLDQARLLAGHRLPGAADAYVLRQPRAVAKGVAPKASSGDRRNICTIDELVLRPSVGRVSGEVALDEATAGHPATTGSSPTTR